MLKSKSLSFQYHPTSPVLSFPDIELDKGNHLLVLGKSGSGKSTLLGLWSGLLTPQSGKIVINDTDITTLPLTKKDQWRAGNIGLVFQQARLIESQSVLQNIEMPALLSGQKPNREQTILALEELNISHLKHRFPANCSVGEQQRVGIIRALYNKPSIILADEPTSALDRDNAEHVVSILKQQAEKHQAILVIVTHDDRIVNQFDHILKLS